MSNPNGCYVLHCKVVGGDAYEVPFEGYEDLSDVLSDIEAVCLAESQPWARKNIADYSAFGVIGLGAYDGEFAVASL